MIVGPCRIVTGGPEPQVIEDGGVRVVGAHIAQVCPIATLAASHPEETVWPARGRVMLPGLVNTHAHLARHLARGLAMEQPGEWDRYDRALSPEDVHWASLAALVEGARHGVTTVFDLHRSGACLDLSLSEVTSAAARLGVRLATCYGVAEEDTEEERRAAHAESVSLASDLRRRREGRLRGLLGMRPRTLAGLDRLIGEASGLGADELALHVDLALDVPPAAGWAGTLGGDDRPALWGHAERAPRALLRRLEERGDALAPAGPALETLPPGVEIAWGSDAGVNAPPLPAGAENAGATGALGAEAYYGRRFVHGARWAARHFGEGLGVLEPGAPADLVLVDYRPATEFGARTLLAHLVTGIVRAPVSGVMVAGQIVLDHGTVVTVDEAEVAARARECARRVWARV